MLSKSVRALYRGSFRRSYDALGHRITKSNLIGKLGAFLFPFLSSKKSNHIKVRNTVHKQEHNYALCFEKILNDGSLNH